MGGSAKKQTVGFKYKLGGHLVFFEGHADRLLRIQFLDGDKRITALEGSAGPGRISIDKPKLFGGEKKQGGVVGDIDFEDGAPTQGQNDYLLSKLGALINAARGVTALVFRRVYLGMNPQLKPVSCRFQRIHRRSGDVAQWYDAKSAIPAGYSITVTVPEEVLYEDAAMPGDLYIGPPTDPDHTFTISGLDPLDVLQISVPGGGAYTAWSRWASDGFNGGLTWGNGVWITDDDDVTTAYLDTYPATTWYFATPEEAAAAAAAAPPMELTGSATYRLHFNDWVVNLNRGGLSLRVVKLAREIEHPCYDMNPAHIVRELETDTYSGSGLPESEVDDDYFTAAADTLFEEGFGLSFLWRQQGPASDMVDEILRHIDAVRRVDRATGALQIKLIRPDYDPESLLVLDDESIVEVEDLSRPQPGELITTLTVVFWDSRTSKDSSVTVHNPALIQQLGREIPATLQYPAITRRDLALRVAMRDLRRLSYPILAGRFTATRKAAQLNLGDPFILRWPRLGVASVIMRVVDIGLGDGRSNRVQIQAAEDVFALPDNVYITPVAGDWEPPTTTPAASPARLVIEAPYLEIVQHLGQTSADAELAAVPEAGYLLVAAQRPSDDALNAEIQVDAGAGYDEGGTLDFCPVALLAADIGPTETAVTLTGAVDVEELAVGSLAQLGDELVRIDAIDATTATLGRGVLDTVPVAHLAGERLWGIDLYAASDFTQYVDGETISVKVLPATGQGELDIADAPADSLTLNQRAIRPYPPADVRITGSSFPASVNAPAVVTWVDRNRVQQTSGTLLDWFDGGVTPEAGQTTTIRLLSGATVLETWSGETDGTVTLATFATGTYTLEATSQRDGYDSFQTFTHEFLLIGSDVLMTADGVALETADGQILTE